ncbi:MAG: DUF3592 domain-containing protein [Flammeovirgaceae bacterium]
MDSIIFLYIALWMPAIAATVMALMDFAAEKKFMKSAIQTQGRIVGTLGAKYKVNNPAQVDMAAMATANAMSQYVKGDRLGGVLVMVEFEDKNGDTYQVRSKQAFNVLESDHVTVHYNPDNPGDAIIDRYYSGKGKVYQLIAAGILFVAPFIIDFLMG